jgi:calmodulin
MAEQGEASSSSHGKAGDEGRKHPTLSEEDLQEFREIFNLVDTDRGGSIGTEELARLMDTLGIRTSPEELKLMVSEIDENGNGEIDFDEFVQVMCRKVNTDYTADEVQKAFNVFAGDAPEGFIKRKDLEKALQLYGHEKLSPEEAANLVAQIECVGGMFHYQEYISMMMLEH